MSIGDDCAAEFERVCAQKQLPDNIPEVLLDEQPIPLKKLLVQLGLAKSNSEAKRLIHSGAVKIWTG